MTSATTGHAPSRTDTAATSTRTRAAIPKRRVDFGFDASTTHTERWANDDVFLTAFLDALSLVFPEGERFFVQSVRRYRERVSDPSLLEAIDGFVAQEAMHGKAHRELNEAVHARGRASAPALEKQVVALLNFVRGGPPKMQLAVTCALEHFTAILAEQLLAEPELRDSLHADVRPLWIWHALEESEHKAVAFDVYRAVGGRYPLRALVMLVTTVIFFAKVSQIHMRFLREDGALFDARGWARLLAHFWVKPGSFRKLVPAYLDYYRPSFHPDDRDTRALLATWRERLFGAGGTLNDKLRAS